MALSLVKNATKLTLAGGAVYWSVQQGIWGTTNEGAEAGRKLKDVIAPSTSDYVDKIPSMHEVNDKIVKNWNTGMKTVFSTASNLPELSEEYASKAQNAVSDLVSK